MSTRRNFIAGLAAVPLIGNAAVTAPVVQVSRVLTSEEQTALALVTKWAKILGFRYYGDENDYKNRDFCLPLEYGNAEPLAVACAGEMQQFEDQYKMLVEFMPLDESDRCNKLHWYRTILKSVIPWIRRRYSANVHPLACCQFDLQQYQLDMYPIVHGVFPWSRTGKVVSMTYENSKSITEPDIFSSFPDIPEFETQAIELLA